MCIKICNFYVAETICKEKCCLLFQSSNVDALLFFSAERFFFLLINLFNSFTAEFHRSVLFPVPSYFGHRSMKETKSESANND